MSSAGKTQIIGNPAAINDGDSIAAYLADVAGNFLTSQIIQTIRRLDVNGASEWASDDAYGGAGEYGTLGLAVRSDAGGTLVSADGDRSPLSVDANGRLYVNATVTVDYSYAEDTAAVDGAMGASILGVRNDAFASQTSTDGDYGWINIDSAGRVGIRGSYAEDSGHTSGDVLVGVAGVRNDANAVLTSADLDYSPISVDSSGRVKTVTSGSFAEDTAHTTGDLGFFMLGVRQDTTAATAGTTGDYSAIQTWSNGEVKSADVVNLSNLQQVVGVTTTAVALPAAALANRKRLFIQHVGLVGFIFVGSATVTNSGATRGFRLGAGGYIQVEAGPAQAVFAASSAGTIDTVVWELS